GDTGFGVQGAKKQLEELDRGADELVGRAVWLDLQDLRGKRSNRLGSHQPTLAGLGREAVGELTEQIARSLRHEVPILNDACTPENLRDTLIKCVRGIDGYSHPGIDGQAGRDSGTGRPKPPRTQVRNRAQGAAASPGPRLRRPRLEGQRPADPGAPEPPVDVRARPAGKN